MKLNDAHIIVTGAAQGMGRHFALRLAEAGALVSAGDILAEGLETLEEEAAGYRGKIFGRLLDVRDSAARQAFVEDAIKTAGPVRGLINNAAILKDELLVKKDRLTGSLTLLDEARLSEVFAVNLTGATLMARDVIAEMIRHDIGGVVVNMSSIARHGNRGQTSYAASKAALAANTRTWALEFARYNIRVGAVAPGMIETAMTQGMPAKAREAAIQSIPLGRIGEPEDIWLAVRFIFECDYFTGRTIDVDGGLSF
jgi:3-oxoacyl-[acyl-carrier protein] reductase